MSHSHRNRYGLDPRDLEAQDPSSRGVLKASPTLGQGLISCCLWFSGSPYLETLIYQMIGMHTPVLLHTCCVIQYPMSISASGPESRKPSAPVFLLGTLKIRQETV